jgi:hypothetical protein
MSDAVIAAPVLVPADRGGACWAPAVLVILVKVEKGKK